MSHPSIPSDAQISQCTVLASYVAANYEVARPCVAWLVSDGSEEDNYNTNVDCGVLLEAAEGELVAVKFDEFDVGSVDRVDLLVSVHHQPFIY